MYEATRRASELCNMFADDRSKKVFWSRFKFDVDPSMESARELAESWSGRELPQKESSAFWREKIQCLLNDGNRIFLYGTSLTGRKIASVFKYEGIDFTGFCDRRAEAYPNGLNGKTVVTPGWLCEHSSDSYVVITASVSFKSIYQFLVDCHFPESHILPIFLSSGEYEDEGEQYFDFPELYPQGTAFIDGGCYDAESSLKFSKFCSDTYSHIYAFEPDPKNYEIAKSNFERSGLRDVTLLKSGISDKNKSAKFFAKGTENSHILSDYEISGTSEETSEIDICTIDSIVQRDHAVVGMIKMDIEGAEMDALRGAKETIMRDKPLLAICVYHKPGDVLAIMDYCATLVPEYRFRLRQYYWMTETVLYASIK